MMPPTIAPTGVLRFVFSTASEVLAFVGVGDKIAVDTGDADEVGDGVVEAEAAVCSDVALE